MASVNKVIALGNLGRDPETRYTQGGDAVCNFSIACNETWKDKSGEKQEKTEWVRCVAFGRTAEIAGEYLQKGKQVYVEGRLQTRKYEKDGQDHYATEVIVDRLQLLGSKSDDGERRSANDRPPATRRGGPPSARDKNVDDFSDDTPFVAHEPRSDWDRPRFERRIGAAR